VLKGFDGEITQKESGRLQFAQGKEREGGPGEEGEESLNPAPFIHPVSALDEALLLLISEPHTSS
jgi:hypothetical protein